MFLNQEKVENLPKHSSIAFLTGVFAGGNFVSSLLKMTSGFLTVKVIEPAVLGLFNGIGLVLGYAPILQLGILNGLSRELPYFIGKGEHDRARELTSAAQAWAIMIGSLVAAGLLVVALWQLFKGRIDLAVGWATYAVSAMLLFYSQLYLQVTYRTHGDFARLAMINVINSGTVLVLVILVWLFNFYGLCLRALIAGCVGLALLWYWRPIRVRPIWNRAHLWHLFKIGAPIFGVGQLYACWIVLDSTLVLKFAGTTGLGLYAVVVMAGQTMGLLPSTVSQITYPRMAEQYGRTHNLKDCIKIVKRPIFFLMLVVIPMVIVGWFLVAPFFNYFLPRYAGAIQAVRWSLVTASVLCLDPFNNSYNVIKRQDLSLVCILLGMFGYYGSLMYLIRKGVYLAAFPQAMVAGQTIFFLFSMTMLFYLWRKEKHAKG